MLGRAPPLALRGRVASAMRGVPTRETRGWRAQEPPLPRRGQDSRRSSAAPPAQLARAVDPYPVNPTPCLPCGDLRRASGGTGGGRPTQPPTTGAAPRHPGRSAPRGGRNFLRRFGTPRSRAGAGQLGESTTPLRPERAPNWPSHSFTERNRRSVINPDFGQNDSKNHT